MPGTRWIRTSRPEGLIREPGLPRIAEIPSPASLSSVAGRPPGLSKRTAGWTSPTLEGCSHSVMGGDSVEVTARAETLPPHPAIATAQAATNRREPDSGRRACVIPRSPLTNMMDAAAPVHPCKPQESRALRQGEGHIPRSAGFP